MIKLLLLLSVLAILTGCVSKPQVTDIMPFGPETYRVKAFNNKGMEDKLAIEEAYKHCESLERHFMPVQGEDTYLQYSLIFSCLEEGDPALKRPEKR
jgi:hypothetical protein